MRSLTALLFALPAALAADDVYLRGGGQITGDIVARDEASVTVDLGAGRMTVRLSEVERIVEGKSPLAEYRERAGALAPDDAEAWREVARWARRQGLAAQAREAWERVAAVLPDDAEAQEALGRVQLDGRWVSEEEAFRAHGFVDFEGEWITPEEQRAILDERAAREQEEAIALEEQIRAEEEAHREREAREAAEDEAFWARSRPPSGGMVYWGWGPGPTEWPDVP